MKIGISELKSEMFGLYANYFALKSKYALLQTNEDHILTHDYQIIFQATYIEVVTRRSFFIFFLIGLVATTKPDPVPSRFKVLDA